MSRQRTMAPSVTPRIRNPDSAQIGELAQVDQQRGLGEAEREHRHQALAAGDRLGVVVRGEEFDRFRECGRAGIVEGRQFHDLDASFALHATRSTWRLVPIIGSKHRSTRCATPACDRLVLSPGSVRRPSTRSTISRRRIASEHQHQESATCRRPMDQPFGRVASKTVRARSRPKVARSRSIPMASPAGSRASRAPTRRN